MSIGQELLNAPFPELVKNLGVGIAEAQYALDKVSVRIAQMMGGFKYDAAGNFVQDDSALVKLSATAEPVSLLALGFTPTFYQFVETYIELKMAISMKTSKEASAKIEASGKSPFGIYSASVNASYSQKYQYEASGSSLMRTKLVTVPSPAIFEQRIKELMVKEKPDE